MYEALRTTRKIEVVQTGFYFSLFLSTTLGNEFPVTVRLFPSVFRSFLALSCCFSNVETRMNGPNLHGNVLIQGFLRSCSFDMPDKMNE